MIANKIKSSVLDLPPTDRVQLAEMIYDSLDKPDESIEKIWINESENRYKAYKSGKIKGISLQEIRSKFEK